MQARRLVLSHIWVGFAAFLVAALLGFWQMWARSPIAAPDFSPANYYLSVTAHGVSMAYVLPTFFVMGFGYFTAVTALNRSLPGQSLAWLGFGLAVVGAVMAAVTVFAGQASVLYTFYPPLTANVFFW
jgi:cytochrome c oxidase subunit 1